MLWLVMLAASMAALAPGHTHPAIGVYIDFDAIPSAQSVDAMKREAGQIMDSAGYFLDWRALKQNQGNEDLLPRGCGEVSWQVPVGISITRMPATRR